MERIGSDVSLSFWDGVILLLESSLSFLSHQIGKNKRRWSCLGFLTHCLGKETDFYLSDHLWDHLCEDVCLHFICAVPQLVLKKY